MSRPNTAAGAGHHRPDRHLVVVGASARAMAESAARAGWAVHAADLFCDVDLQAIAHAAVATAHDTGGDGVGYPWSLLLAAADFPAWAPWCYTGAIENHPDLIDAIARERPLAGNAGDAVRHVRDPASIAAAAMAAGLAFPETRTSPDGVPLDGSFLVKPVAGAGGRGIRRWTPGEAAGRTAHHATPPRQPQLWQRFAPGTPLSASYCFAQGSVRLLGVSRQLIGEPWCHAGIFAWCGAVALSAGDGCPEHGSLIASLEQFGGVLAERFRPIGLVGVDFVVDANDRVTVIEVNPRPTASMELFERSGAGSIAGSHLTACGFAMPSDISFSSPAPRPASVWAKAVLFAVQPTPISQRLLDAITRETNPWTQADGGWHAVADIPRPGQVIPVGAPVVTIFAMGATDDDATTVLRGRVADIDALLAARF